MKRIYSENLKRMEAQQETLLRRQDETIQERVDDAILAEKNRMNEHFNRRLEHISADFEKEKGRLEKINQMKQETSRSKYDLNLDNLQKRQEVQSLRNEAKVTALVEDHQDKRTELVDKYEHIIKNQKGY